MGLEPRGCPWKGKWDRVDFTELLFPEQAQHPGKGRGCARGGLGWILGEGSSPQRVLRHWKRLSRKWRLPELQDNTPRVGFWDVWAMIPVGPSQLRIFPESLVLFLPCTLRETWKTSGICVFPGHSLPFKSLVLDTLLMQQTA